MGRSSRCPTSSARSSLRLRPPSGFSVQVKGGGNPDDIVKAMDPGPEPGETRLKVTLTLQQASTPPTGAPKP